MKVGASGTGTSTFTLDTFQIDATTPALVPIQSLPFNATYVAAAADPADHGIVIFANQPSPNGASPTALLFAISFDPSTGLATVPAAGLSIGNNARSMAISPASGYLALGYGDTMGAFAVYQISSTNFGMALVGNVNLGLEDGGYGNFSFPDSLLLSPGGNLLYVQGPPSGFDGSTGPPYLVFDPTTSNAISTPPIPLAQSNFLLGVADPQAPFTYTGNSGPTYGVSVYQVNLSTGTSSQPAAISTPFFPQLYVVPLFVTVQQGGEGIQAPTLGANPGSLTFASTTAGQASTPQNIVLKSLGAEAVTLSSIQIAGTNDADFSEIDNCIASPVLPTNHTCTIAVTYAPGVAGTSQAALVITDNAAGSPQAITLSGTAVAPPPAAPAVTLSPSTALTFPGTPTQGTTTAPQVVTLTNSGGAPLQILSAVLSGFNAADFSISADTCSGSIAPNANCTISVVFSPQASGIRTTTLSITNNAANSPQTISVTGTAIPAANVSPVIGGSTTATITAGQTAQFNLQASPGTGFTGTLSFSCSGAPFGATCTVPASVSVTNGAAVPFTVSVSTLAASQTAAAAFCKSQFPPVILGPKPILIFLFVLLALLAIDFHRKHSRFLFVRRVAASVSITALLFLNAIGCGSAGSTTAQSAPAAQTAATPAIQPAAGTYGAPQTVSIADVTAGATIYYTTDGSIPTTASPIYSSPFNVATPVTVQAMAAATNYANSPTTMAAYNFRTPTGTFPLTVNITATPAGSGKSLQLMPITLTLVVN